MQCSIILWLLINVIQVIGISADLPPDIGIIKSGQSSLQIENIFSSQSSSLVSQSDSRDEHQDLVIIGGIDGQLYVFNAWTGSIVSSFDSGGPMMTKSMCPGTSDVNASSRSSSDPYSTPVDTQLAQSIMEQVVPSYDGRLYQLSPNLVKEFEVTMADIIHANGPVRVSDSYSTIKNSNQESSNDLNILLFGEKTIKSFMWEASKSSTTQKTPQESSTIVFGRSEFTTKAIHATNSSVSKCFKICEYFLQFLEPSYCTLQEEEMSSSYLAPTINVALSNEDVHHLSNIQVFDPYSHDLLWEFSAAGLDPLAVYGVSVKRRSIFFNWKVDGPSSTSGKYNRGGALELAKYGNNLQVEIKHDMQSHKNIQIASTLIRTPDVMETAYRLRLHGDQYFLQSNIINLKPYDEQIINKDIKASINGRIKRKVSSSWKRFWKPVVKMVDEDGETGVFLTYYHIGVLIVMVTLTCMLIAWGFYVKGLSTASLAQSAFRSLEHNSLFISNVHRLTIEGDDGQIVIVSSVVSRALLLDVKQSQSPLLKNDPDLGSFPIDAETEELILKKFAQRAPEHAGTIISSSPGYLSPHDTLDYAHLFTNEVGSRNILSNVGENRVYDVEIIEEDYASGRTDEYGNREEADALQVSKEAESSKALRPSLSQQVIITSRDTRINDTLSTLSDSNISQSTMSNNNGRDSNGVDNQDNEVAWSDDSSSTSQELAEPDAKVVLPPHNGEVEVFFPFVCQSRFTNEFEEISGIGKGGFGHVMLAENRLDGRKYAIKRVGLYLEGQTPKTLHKFLREVKILALLDHPNIVRYYQAWLEKVEDVGETKNSEKIADGGSEYTVSNLLAPIAEIEFELSKKRISTDFSFEQNMRRESYLDENDDGDDGFIWEREPLDELQQQANGWHEDDLLSANATRKRNLRNTNFYKASNESGDNSELGIIFSNPASKLTGNTAIEEMIDHWLYIQMQYCAGKNLGDYIMSQETIDLEKLLKIFLQIASALAHVHSHDLIHRDLKPANIFVADTDCESIKLGDFGLSRHAANSNSSMGVPAIQNSSNSVGTTARGSSIGTSLEGVNPWLAESIDVTGGVGTYLYASPEQVAGEKYTAKTDLYSLGMILFELSHTRFTTTMERVMTLRNARDRKFPNEWKNAYENTCPPIVEMITLLLHPDANERPNAKDVADWAQDLYDTRASLRSPKLGHQSYGIRSPRASFRTISLPDLPNPSSLPGMPFVQSLPKFQPINTEISSVVYFQVQAKMSSQGGDRSHKLLTDICDLIAEVSQGLVSIQKYGVDCKNDVQLLEFLLKVRPSAEEKDCGTIDLNEAKNSYIDSNDSTNIRAHDRKAMRLLISAIKELGDVEEVRILNE